MSKWIKKGDKVVLIAGNDKGRTGTVLRRNGDRVVVQGINIRKKHVKRKTQMQTPTIIEMEVAVHISNVSLCNEQDKPVRAKIRESKEGKELYYSQGKQEVALRTLRN